MPFERTFELFMFGNNVFIDMLDAKAKANTSSNIRECRFPEWDRMMFVF